MGDIGIIINTMNDELLEISLKQYEKLPYNRYIINGKGGLYGLSLLESIITKNEINHKYLVFIDEDCFITKPESIINMVDFMENEGVHVCGVPDGGVVSARGHNPFYPNLFFVILNLEKIREVYTTNINKTNIEYKLPNIIKRNYIIDDFEPYYKVFSKLLNNGLKFHYLNADDVRDIHTDLVDDKISSLVYDTDGDIFAYHSWYARQFSGLHNKRINNLIKFILNLVIK